jgi:LysR family transcriptional activator of dmlA
VNKVPSNEDLRVFTMVARQASFAAAAEELGVSPSYITKRIHILEGELGSKLFHRTTRRVVVTETGERIYQLATRILNEVDHLIEEIDATGREPRGSLRICSSFGFGRRIVGPALSRMVERYPSLQVRLDVFDRLVDIADEGFDLDVRVGDEIAPNMIARKLASNHRVLAAAPAYLKRRGAPRALADLPMHDCLITKERDHPFGVWRLRSGDREDIVKVTGPLSSNNGEVVVQWAVNGRGILLRSTWDIGALLDAGRLVQVLPEYRQEANVWAVYPSRLEGSAKVRVCVEWLQRELKILEPGRRPRRARDRRSQARSETG